MYTLHNIKVCVNETRSKQKIPYTMSDKLLNGLFPHTFCHSGIIKAT